VADDYWWPQIEIDSRAGALNFPHDDYQARKSFGQGLIGAVQAARSARFEHGTEGVRPTDRDISGP
jgi:hypothetical protein